jgi:hypothetical protein
VTADSVGALTVHSGWPAAPHDLAGQARHWLSLTAARGRVTAVHEGGVTAGRLLAMAAGRACAVIDGRWAPVLA